MGVGAARLPVPIRFDEAIAVAVIGLLVKVICALLLKDGHTDHHHDDLNLRSAYLHVLADAFTSVTAVAALLAGRFFGWSWLDPVMGLRGHEELVHLTIETQLYRDHHEPSRRA